MKTAPTLLAIGALMLASSTAAQPKASVSPLAGTARSAVAVVDRFHAALAQGDAATAAALLDPGATIFEEGSAEASSAEYQASHLPADIAFLKTVHESVVERRGTALGRMAWIATRGRLEGRFQDRPVDRLTTESMVLQRGPHGWRIVHIHWSSRAASGG